MGWSGIGWDLEVVLSQTASECCERTTQSATMMVGGLGWMHVGCVHSHGALLVCACMPTFAAKVL